MQNNNNKLGQNYENRHPTHSKAYLFNYTDHSLKTPLEVIFCQRNVRSLSALDLARVCIPVRLLLTNSRINTNPRHREDETQKTYNHMTPINAKNQREGELLRSQVFTFGENSNRKQANAITLSTTNRLDLIFIPTLKHQTISNG